MEVKPGYKQTEVGVIPEEWGVEPLGELVSYTKGFPFKSSEYQSTGIRVIRVSDTTYDSIKAEDPIFVSDSSASRYLMWQLKEHDLVVSTVGSKPPMYDSMVGKVILIDHLHENTLLNQNAVLIRDRKRRGYVQRLLLNHLRTKRYLIHIEAIYRGNANQASITLKELFQFKIPLPSDVSEQRAIAAALSAVDALLDGLDRLIAKKRDLKQAAMQQLLTGQTRLPGFSGAWEETKFDKVVRHHAGNSTLIKGKLPPSEAAGLFPAYSASGQDVWCDHFEHEGDAIVVSAVGSRCGKAFAASGKWCAIANTHVVWPNPAKIDGRFLGYFINDEDFWQKSGTGQPFVLFAKTFARPLRLPDLPEQIAIAAVLSDMDAELAALEARRAKTHDLKQAMMQELLTGRTRLA